MPLLEISYPDPDQTLGIWEVNESEDELMTLISQEVKIQEKLPQQRKSKLAVHILLKEITGKFHSIQKTNSGIPFISGTAGLSYSHSGKFIAVLTNKKGPTGIDIQISYPGIEKLTSKFISVREEAFIYTFKDTISCFHMIWCIKEAVYKYFGEKKLIFKEDIQIQPFMEDDEEIGVILRKKGEDEHLRVALRKNKDFFMAYIIK